jgi:peptide/nickel transport system substrate-binding protein
MHKRRLAWLIALTTLLVTLVAAACAPAPTPVPPTKPPAAAPTQPPAAAPTQPPTAAPTQPPAATKPPTVAPTQPPPTQPAGGTVIWGYLQQPSRLNPIVAPDVVTKWLIETIFDGLVAINDKMEMIPELATAWDISADGKVYTFKLRTDVKWHDGKPFTAEDVKFTYDSIIDPKQPNTLAKSDYALVSKIEVVDPNTVRFTLTSANSSFLSKLAIGIAPKHLLEGQQLDTAAFNRKPVGTGAFIVQEWTSGQKVVLDANPNYFRGKPKINRLIWQVIPDSNVLTVQLLNGDIDSALIIDPKDLAKFQNNAKFKVYESIGANTYIGFNNENPLFADPKVRQALNYGLDKKAIIEKILEGQGIWSTSEILAGTWAYNPSVNKYEYDLAKAKALLDDAGWKVGASGIREKGGKPLKFTLLTNAGDKLREAIALFARQQWKDLGADMEVQFLEANTFINDRVLKSNFEVIFLASSVNVDPDFLSRRWSCPALTTGHNFLRWCSQDVDKLLAQGIALTAQPDRKKVYDEIQKIIANESPTVPIYYPKTLWAFKSTLKGIVPSPLNIFWNAEQWSY